LAHVTFHIYDEDVVGSDFIAFASFPVTCLNTGFRSARLYNMNGKTDQDFEYASLFIRVHVEPLP
jgi:hypothetical protein